MRRTLAFAIVALGPCACSPAEVSRPEAPAAAALPVASSAPALAKGDATPDRCPDGTIEVAGGSFTMGERKDPVTVARFCMERSEVTVERYAACVTQRRCSAEHLGERSVDGNTFTASAACNYEKQGRAQHPINCVAWAEASTFCASIGRRLPSEEEWEWAARGGVRATRYPWGGAAAGAQLCWSRVAERKTTCPVGSFPGGDSPLGIHDLAGNVWEWTSTTTSTGEHARRGGGFTDGMGDDTDEFLVRATGHGQNPAGFRYESVGFRCAS